MQRFFLALDLRDDPELIAQYEAYHQNVWPEILAQIQSTGITKCEIYRVANRLVMALETTDDFSFEKKAISDQSNAKVQEWEALMWQYQQALPGSKPGEKWKLMHKIFELN